MGRISSRLGMRERVNQELAVICDEPMWALTSSRQPGFVCLARALADRRVMQSVVHFVRILGQPAVEFLERPDCLPFRVHRLRDLACQARDLSVPLEVVNELGISCLEQAFTDGPETRVANSGKLAECNGIVRHRSVCGCRDLRPLKLHAR